MFPILYICGMGKINFFLKNKKKNQTSIDAIIRYKGKRYVVATGVSVVTEYWNVSSHRCREVRGYPDCLIINSRLDKIEIVLKRLFSNYNLHGLIPGKEDFRADYNSAINGNKPIRDKESVVDYLERFICNSEYEKETLKKYNTTLRWLREYENEFKTRLKFTYIDINFYKQFKTWFYTKTYVKKTGGMNEVRHYSLNYFGSIIKCLKVIMSESGVDGEFLHENENFKHKKFVTEAEDSDSIYLSDDELKMLALYEPKIEDLKKITNDLREHNLARKLTSLNHVKNRFLIGCYTALRVSDFNRIGEVNFKENFIRIKPKKGVKKNEDVVIPIHPVVKNIVESGFDLSLRVSDQKINKHIKEICQILNFDEPVSVVRTEGGRQVERVYPKWQLVTSHTARRSGATNMFKAGIPAISIMKITGHKTEKSFLKYIKISQEENARMLADHAFFN